MRVNVDVVTVSTCSSWVPLGMKETIVGLLGIKGRVADAETCQIEAEAEERGVNGVPRLYSPCVGRQSKLPP